MVQLAHAVVASAHQSQDFAGMGIDRNQRNLRFGPASPGFQS